MLIITVIYLCKRFKAIERVKSFILFKKIKMVFA
jgi:hypothetical protein